jgi:predicted dehydrogenase
MEIKMKFLVIGLGSMGKRRIRNLHALGQKYIAGFDPRQDRRDEANNKYKIDTYSSYEEALFKFSPDVLIISTSPNLHMDYAIPAVEKGLHCFIEASVVEEDRIRQLCEKLRDTNLVISPSCTMRYYPAVKKISEILKSNDIGKPLSINYLTGQFLPDWHPWEDINEYYVSHRDTGGAREIVPFELTWLNEIFGDPVPLACTKDKLSDMDADIDDIYHCILRYPENVLASISVEVLSRPLATRELNILGSLGKISFSSNEDFVKYIKVGDTDWTKVSLKTGELESGYINPEGHYIDEMKDFLNAVDKCNRYIFPNTLEKDVKILQLLNNLDDLSNKII